MIPRPTGAKIPDLFINCKQIWDVWCHAPHIAGLSAMTGTGLIRVIIICCVFDVAVLSCFCFDQDWSHV